MNEIIKDLWLGDEWHAQTATNAGMVVICVLEERPVEEPDNAIHIPIMKYVEGRFEIDADGVLHPPVDAPPDPHSINKPLVNRAEWMVNMINLSIACDGIDGAREMGRAVYVHCAAGVERSPLTVAWYLHTRYNMSLDEAYAKILVHRPIVMDRRAFLPAPYNQE